MSRLIAILAIALVGCSETPSASVTHSPAHDVCDTAVKDPESVSIAALVSNPARFEGLPVRVIGFYHGSFEHSAIYFSQSDFQHHIAPNGLWVANRVPAELNDKYVLLEGIFTTTSRGHMGLWSGMLCGVTRVVPWANEP